MDLTLRPCQPDSLPTPVHAGHTRGLAGRRLRSDLRFAHGPALGLVLAAALALPPSAGAAPAERVEVINLPAVQTITGGVAVTRPVPQTQMDVRRVLVSPAELADTANWTEAGSLETDGFSHLTLSFAGTLQGQGERGAVGVVLLPDVPEVVAALRTFGVLQFPLQAQAPVPPSQSGIFHSEPTTFRLAFPRYRVLLWNASPKSAEVTIWAYLGTS